MKINNKEEKLWLELSNKYDLSDEQINLFKIYAHNLIEHNKITNLTRILDIEDIIHYHFDDSLIISKFIDFNNLKSICDIGTGAGFPGVPLKIMFPHLNTILIEVNNKKRDFLNKMKEELRLDNIKIFPYDWRMFLRTEPDPGYEIEYFFARASLHPDELIRVFKPSSPYVNSKLIYWASMQYEVTDTKELLFFEKEEKYKVGDKERKLIFFHNK